MKCQIECQKECQTKCQIECQNVCDIDRASEYMRGKDVQQCEITCQLVCQNLCQIRSDGCQKNMPRRGSLEEAFNRSWNCTCQFVQERPERIGHQQTMVSYWTSAKLWASDTPLEYQIEPELDMGTDSLWFLNIKPGVWLKINTEKKICFCRLLPWNGLFSPSGNHSFPALQRNMAPILVAYNKVGPSWWVRRSAICHTKGATFDLSMIWLQKGHIWTYVDIWWTYVDIWWTHDGHMMDIWCILPLSYVHIMYRMGWV